MARIDAAYDYFLMTYGEDIGSRYSSHKKSELRETYNSILKTNKESPLYKITQTNDVGRFAIDIKEHANNITRAVEDLSSISGDISSILEKRIATSSNADTVSVNYIDGPNASTESFDIQVKSLATPQVNFGNYLDSKAKAFEEGQYTFDLDIRNNAYEFQFNVNANDTNLDVQNKVARLINTSDIGLVADIVSSEDGKSALFVSSKATGLGENEEELFRIETGTSWRELNTLGIQNISSPAKNSSFVLNGTEHSSLANTFTVNQSFEVTLKAPSDDSVHISLMNDTQALSSGINNLLESYNGMLEVGRKYSVSHENSTLYNEFKNAGRRAGSNLEDIGITIDDMGFFTLDNEKLSKAVNSDKKDNVFELLSHMRDSFSSLSRRASINPMNYVDKIVVEYKNPNKVLSYPYATSQYSGLLVDYGL